MPEKGWVALTVRAHIGAKIKALVGGEGLTVSEYLEKVVSGESGMRSTVKGPKKVTEEWIVCSHCKTRLKTKNLPEHTLRLCIRNE